MLSIDISAIRNWKSAFESSQSPIVGTENPLGVAEVPPNDPQRSGTMQARFLDEMFFEAQCVERAYSSTSSTRERPPP